MLDRGAANLLKQHPEGAGGPVEIDWLHCAGRLRRKPTAAEIETARLPTELADLLWVVFMLPEFQLIR